MRTVLHILTRPQDAFAEDLIRRQRALPETRIVVIDLTGPDPDYGELLDRVFEADSIQSW
jgi:hypothetical protein